MLFYFRSKVINTNPIAPQPAPKHRSVFVLLLIATLETLKAQSKDIKNETTNTPASSPLRLALCLQLLSRFERMIVKIFS
jgi:hypothetical protein